MTSLQVSQITRLVNVRNHKKILNISIREIVTHHRDIRLSRRFRRGPKTRQGGEYLFEPRTRKYQRKKKRDLGHLKPNVFSGETRERAKSAKVRATSKSGSIRFSSHFPMTEERRGEMERISSKEQKQDRKSLRTSYARMAKMRRFKRKRKTRIV